MKAKYLTIFVLVLIASVFSTKIRTLSKTSMKDEKTHTVVEGDTLFKIAQKYNTTVDELVKLNEIKDPNLIYPGQIIKLPQVITPPRAS